MEVAELKIGNFIYHHNYGCVEVVGIFGEEDVYVEDDFGTNHLIPIDEFKPILLTDEVLIQLGWRIYGQLESQDKRDWYWCSYDTCKGAIDYATKVYTSGHQKIKLEGLHHLQNLIHEFARKDIITQEFLDDKPQSYQQQGTQTK